MANPELAVMVSSSAGTSAAVLGFLILHRSKFKNWGWLFPVAVALELVGITNLSHALSYSPKIEPWIDPVFTRPVEQALADSLLLMGFGFAFYRLLRKQLNNSFFKWTTIMAISVMILSTILLQIHLSAPNIYQWFSAWVTLGLTLGFMTLAAFTSRISLSYIKEFLYVYGGGTGLSSISQFLESTDPIYYPASSFLFGLAQFIQCLSYLWLFAFVYTRHIAEISQALDRLAVNEDADILFQHDE